MKSLGEVGEVLAQFNELSQQEDMEKLALCQQKMDNLQAWDLVT